MVIRRPCDVREERDDGLIDRKIHRLRWRLVLLWVKPRHMTSGLSAA
jgi:hypothetical protein